MSKELTELSEDQFVDTINNVFHKASDYGWLGRVPDKILPSFIKSKGFSLPPIVDKLESERLAFPLRLMLSK